MIDVFEIGASLNIHGNFLDFMRAFSGALMGAHSKLEALEKKIGVTKGAMKDLFVGAGEVFAGVEILKGIGHLAEAGKELNHQQSMLMRNGVSQRDVMRETASIYMNMLKAVPTASAVDFLRTLGELKTVKGSIGEAREALVQSLKIEGLIGNSTGKSAEGQGYDFWRAAEDKGIIQDKRATDAMLNRMVQGTIATGGKIGGNDWFSYARAARSAWMGDDIEALPLQLMEMQTLTAPGAGSARRMFSRMIQGGQKLTKTQLSMFANVGMLEDGTTNVRDRQLEHSRPDLFIADLMKHLDEHGIRGKDAQESWALRALNASSAAYFNVARAGMSEIDPESGLTRLQKEARNMGEAQPLDKAYKTMMDTDFGANLHALEEQWKSFTEAVGGPAAKAMIPVLQSVTSFVTDMANFADKNQKLTQIGIDIAAVAGGLLVLGGSLRLIRGTLSFAGSGLLGMGRNALGFGASASALSGSATQLDASALALKEAAAELRARSGFSAGDPTGNALKEAEKDAAKFAPSALPLMGAGTVAAVATAILAGGAGAGVQRAPMLDDFGRTVGNWGGDPAHPFGFDSTKATPRPTVTFGTMWDRLQNWWQGTGPDIPLPPDRYADASPDPRGNALREHDDDLSPAYRAAVRALRASMPESVPTSASLPFHPDDDRSSRSRPSDAPDRSLDRLVVGSNDAAQKLGDLRERTGVVLTSFDLLKGGGATLNTQFGSLAIGSASLDNVFRALEATGLGAARALAQVALSGMGGAGGAGGFTNASWGGAETGLGGGGMSGGGWDGNPVTVAGGFGAGGWTRSGASKAQVAAYIRHVAAGLGIDPGIALRVAASEGLNKYEGDYGTSFGAYQLHYGGSGIRGMNSRGLGDRFTAETGKDARDPTTWKDQIDFALRTAKREGWGAWHGWRGPSRAGMDYRGPLPDAVSPSAAGLPALPKGGYWAKDSKGNPVPVGPDGTVVQGYQPVPLAPPLRSKTFSPGHPADSPGTSAGDSTMAANLPPIVIEHHHHTYMDGKKIAHEVTRHQVADARFKRSLGATDNYGRRAHPGSEVLDA